MLRNEAGLTIIISLSTLSNQGVKTYQNLPQQNSPLQSRRDPAINHPFQALTQATCSNSLLASSTYGISPRSRPYGLANMQLENGMMGYDKKVRIIDLPA